MCTKPGSGSAQPDIASPEELLVEIEGHRHESGVRSEIEAGTESQSLVLVFSVPGRHTWMLGKCWQHAHSLLCLLVS